MAGAEAIPLGDGQFDLALMLKSLHHVPRPSMSQALSEVRRRFERHARPDGVTFLQPMRVRLLRSTRT